MDFEIRSYHPSDLTALYHICLETGDNGASARTLYSDPNLPGHFYAAPYAVLEPDLCFILTHQHNPCGYILGTRDSATFGRRCEDEWFPPLRLRYPLPPAEDKSADAEMIRSLHQGHDLVNDPADFPPHLHIDILPEGQGGGWGRRLIDTFLAR